MKTLPGRSRRRIGISKRPIIVIAGVFGAFVVCYLLIVRSMNDARQAVNESKISATASSVPDALKVPLERSYAPPPAPPTPEETHADSVKSKPETQTKPADPQPSPEQQERALAALTAQKTYWKNKAELSQKRYEARMAGLTSPLSPEIQQGRTTQTGADAGAAGKPPAPGGGDQSSGGGMFAGAESKNAWAASGGMKGPEYLPSLRHGTISPYQIMAGTALPALTEGGIISDSPGLITGKISRDIPCNTPAGLEETKPCIPAGSRIMISYNNKVSQGERRIQVAADRLIFPDSTSMNLGHQVIADASGYSGLADERETHLGERLLNATLFAAVQGVFTLGSAALGADQVNGRPVESVAQDEAQSGMRIPPTLRIRPGFPFVVMLKQDLLFAGPYEPQEFAASEGSE